MMETFNEIRIAHPLSQTFAAYSCREQLPLWAPGFISFEALHEAEEAIGNVYRHRYHANGREVEEIMTILEYVSPNYWRVLSELQGVELFRESVTCFEAIDPATTRIVVQSRWSGEFAKALVKEELEAYTQHYLGRFKDYLEQLNLEQPAE